MHLRVSSGEKDVFVYKRYDGKLQRSEFEARSDIPSTFEVYEKKLV